MSFLRRPGIALLVLLILSIYGFDAHARRRSLSTPATLGDQSAYLGYARDLYESNYTVVEARNRMPVFPFLLSFIYRPGLDRKSTRLNSSHSQISYAVFCLKKKIIIKNYDINKYRNQR